MDGILSKEELVELEKIQQAVSDDNEYMQDGGSTYYDLDAERMFDQRYKLLCLLRKALQHPDAQTAPLQPIASSSTSEEDPEAHLREEFETWFRRTYTYPLRRQGHGYDLLVPNECWRAWLSGYVRSKE